MNTSMNHAVKDEDDDFLYVQIADRFIGQMETGILKAGDKMMSLRTLSKELGISISTSYQAYVELENKGYLEARPKSGYFVKYSPGNLLKPLAAAPPLQKVKITGVDEMIGRVYQSNTAKDVVVRLSIATPSAKLIPEAKLNKAMMEALRQSPSSCTQYEELQGNKALRVQIARHALNWNGSISEDDVVTTQGCMEALVFCLKAVTKPGDTVAIESPTYFGIFNVMKTLGLNVLEVPVHPSDGVDIDYLENALLTIPVKACLFVPNFCNPVGALMPDHKKKQLVELLAKKQIPLIEDDIYGEMYFGKHRPRTCKSYDQEGMVMLCSSVSKTLAPGYRVGWCLPGKFIDKVISMKLMHTVSSATPTQAAIAIFYETGRYDLHMRNLRKALHTQSLRYIQAISAYFPTGTKVSRPMGGYVLWVELEQNVNALKLFERALEQNISIAPGQIFSIDGRFSHYIRIGFGNPFDKEIDEGLKKLGELAKG